MDLDLHEATTRIVAAYLRGNEMPPEDVAAAISKVFEALQQLTTPAVQVAPAQTPAVPIKKSVTSDHLVCLECGNTSKMMKRHLEIAHGMTPEQYRTKWELSRDYPMVAPSYAKLRSEMAFSSGLGGRKSRNVVSFNGDTGR